MFCATFIFQTRSRAYEFQGGQFASQVRLASFSFHWQRSVMWAARDAVFVKGIAIFFHREFYSQRNKGFFKSEIPKKRFVDFNGIKRGIAKECFRIDKRMFPEVISQNRKQSF